MSEPAPEAEPKPKRPPTLEQFAYSFDRRLAQAALWFGGLALVVAALTVFLHITRGHLTASPWSDLREASGWLLLVYLPAAFSSIVLGLFVVWVSRDFKASGALASIFGGGSILLVLIAEAIL